MASSSFQRLSLNVFYLRGLIGILGISDQAHFHKGFFIGTRPQQEDQCYRIKRVFSLKNLF